jgi:hypothetical protein
MRRPICALGFVFLNALLICAQSTPDLKQRGTVLLEAGRVLDVQKGNYLQDVAILIDGDRISEIGLQNCKIAHQKARLLSIFAGPRFFLA